MDGELNTEVMAGPKTLSALPGALLVTVAVILGYWHTLDVPFQFDDTLNITRNFNVHRLDPAVIFHMKPSRFLGMMTIALNYHFNEDNVLWYHAVNTLIHLGASLSFYWLLGGLLRAGVFRLEPSDPRGRALQVFGALLFALHPLQTQAVTYVIQRLESLAAFFYIAAVASYLESRLAERRSRSALFLALAVLLSVCGMFSKETAFTIPFAAAAVELAAFGRGKAGETFARRLLWILPLFILLPIVPVLLRTQGVLHRVRSDMGVTPWPYLLTQMKAHLIYLKLLAAPWGQNVDYDCPIATTPWNGAVIAGALLLLALLAAGFALFRRLPLAALGIFWYFIAISISSSFIPIPDMIFEHRVYPAMPGFAMVLCAFASFIKPTKALVGVCLVLSVVYGGLTFARNELWRDPVKLWADVVRKSPNKARAHLDLGVSYMRETPPRIEEGKRCFQKALEIQPNYQAVHLNLAQIYESAGERQLAIDHYKQAVSGYDKISAALAYYRVGVMLYKEHKDAGARGAFEEALKLYPNDVNSLANLGVVYSNLGKSDKAIALYLEAIRFAPQHMFAHENLGIEYLKIGKAPEAEKEFALCIAMGSEKNIVHRGAAQAAILQGKLEAAREYLKRALTNNNEPNDVEAFWLRLEVALRDKDFLIKDPAERKIASDCARNILAIDPKNSRAKELGEIAGWR